ncbi:MAG TPA: DUF1566 domain-containing protein [Steroidobacteraceae bacterium]|nr:DUF1566 domain-containing protein [Steroidobacteraceae bacterium]
MKRNARSLNRIVGPIAALSVSCGFVSTAGAQANIPGTYYPVPSWDQKLPASRRFVVLSNWSAAAVLDRETGLVWERAPSSGTTHLSWYSALEYCANLSVAHRKGWRLPTIQELGSLVTASVPYPGPALPEGHPFIGLQEGGYWSSTSHVQLPDVARVMVVNTGDVANNEKNGFAYTWCVRGGSGPDSQ